MTLLYLSLPVWASKAAFTGWTQFEPFRAPVVTQAPTSRSISAIPSSRASRQSRRSRIQMRGIRPPEQRPVAIDAWRFLYYISLAKRPKPISSNWKAPPDDGGELIVCAVRSNRFDPFAMWANNRCLRANRPSGVDVKRSSGNASVECRVGDTHTSWLSYANDSADGRSSSLSLSMRFKSPAISRPGVVP